MADLDSETSSEVTGGHVCYLCSTCSLPLGDSGDCIPWPADDNIILLKAVSENVEIDENKAVSSYELDNFSTVQVLYCKGCTSSLGALYLATPGNLDYKRDLFNLNTSAVNCYFFDNPKKQQSKFQKSVYFPNVIYMEAQLKKCRTVFGFCERGVTEIEMKLFQSSTSS